MLHQTVSQKLQRAFFFTFTESKHMELILYLKHLIEYCIASNKHLPELILLQNFQEVGTYFTGR